jgi:hypothetical protein
MDAKEARQRLAATTESTPSQLMDAENFEAMVCHTLAEQRARIDDRIAAAVDRGERSTVYEYCERISLRSNPDEVVTAIRMVAEGVSEDIVTLLEDDGFTVHASSQDRRDYRDSIGAPAEYVVNSFAIKWA